MKESYWKDAKIAIAAKKDNTYISLCSQCGDELKYTFEELRNSTAENPIVCNNCGHQSYTFWTKEELEEEFEALTS
jgi:DNA-directed RNA polymerase subunit RPC12/RpoP